MIRLSFLLFGLAACGVAFPLRKRIAQTIADSTTQWELACIAAGGGQRCNPLSVAAFSTLLAAPGPCEQQEASDNMIDLAKTLSDNTELIRLTQIFVQQPRNTPTSQSVQYCQHAPRNTELTGLFQCQFAGANPVVFVGGVAVGQAGTIPFGLKSPVSPAGSCPAHRSGPIADGSQLVGITQVPGGSGARNGTAITPPPSVPSSIPPTKSTPTHLPAVSSGSTGKPAGGFRLKNGKDAQVLNAKFTTLNNGSSCQVGEVACVGGDFAQCVDGKFVTTACSPPLSCFSLPLVNAPGTSIACTTEADASNRITATGALGGITGFGSGGLVKSSIPASATCPVVNPTTGTKTVFSTDFKLQNRRDAQALNAKFTALTPDSACAEGEEACIGLDFAQCVHGKFVVMQCGSTLTCAALPLANKPGTSVACTTAADALALIHATGVAGGFTGP